MLNLTCLRKRLRFLVPVVLSVVCCHPVSAQPCSVLEHAEQTDEDYRASRIEELVGQLEHKLELDRYPAYRTLSELGPEARPALELFIDALDEKSDLFGPETFQEFAFSALVSMGPDALDRLRDRFPLESIEAKLMIARAIEAMGADSRFVLPGLRDEWLQAEGFERLKILQVIVAVDPYGETAIPLLLKSLSNQQDPQERMFAARWLSRHPQGLQNADVDSQAAQWFEGGGQDPNPVVDQLLKLLGDEVEEVRLTAADSLTGFPECEDRIVPTLLGLLYVANADQDDPMLAVATQGLSRFPKSAELIVPAIVKWSDTDNKDVVWSAQRTLAVLVPLTKEPLSHLKSVLAGEHPERALLTVARMGRTAQPLISSIEPLTEKREPVFSYEPNPLQALVTLGCIDPGRQEAALNMLDLFQRNREDIFPFLEQVGENAAFAASYIENRARNTLVVTTDEPDSNLRLMSLVRFLDSVHHRSPMMRDLLFEFVLKDSYYRDELLEILIRSYPEMIPQLAESLGDPKTSATKRIIVLQLLAASHSDDRQLIPLIVAELESDHPAVRESAVLALGELGVKTIDSEQGVIQGLIDSRVRVRVKALESLASFGEKAGPVLPFLTECLLDDYLSVRVAAVRCLGELGQTARPAVDALEKLQDSVSQLLRETVAETLAKIRL